MVLRDKKERNLTFQEVEEVHIFNCLRKLSSLLTGKGRQPSNYRKETAERE